METNRTALAGRHDALLGLLAFSLIALLVFLSIYLHRPPSALSADAPPSQFSAERAMKDLRVIAEKPHPIGSAENAKVGAYIAQRLSALGLDAQVRKTTVVNRLWGNPYAAATVQNILARVKGLEGGKAVLLVGHFDSVPNGPGASDDGAAIAGLLELARALKSLPPLKNDLIFLFTDGEEAGLLGATAFVKEDPWARDVGLVLNFEARGNSGPVYMFETSPQNGWLIQEFARAAPHSFASSLMYDIYKTLPHDTDLTVFKEAGLAALNFANIKNPTHYHTRLDSLENVDQRTLQQKGATALALARHFGNLNLANARRADAIYFDISGLSGINYPVAWTIPLAVLTAVVFVAVFVLGLKRRRLTVRGVALGIIVFIPSVVIPAALVMLIWGIVRTSFAEYRFMPASGSYHGLYLFIGFMALTVALFLGVLIFAQRRVRILDLWLGALFVWLLLMITSVFYLPGASYLLMWPLLLSLHALGSVFIPKEQPYRIGRVVVFSELSPKRSFEEFITIRQLIVLSLCAILTLLLWVPVVYMIYLGIGLSNVFVLVILAGLLLGSITPHLILMTKYKKWLLPGALALVGIGFLAVGCLNSGFDAQHPKPNSVFYGLDADKNEARFLSTDAQEDEWTSQFFSGKGHHESAPAFFPLSDTQLLQSPAPVVALPAPGITLLEDSTTNDVRVLRLRITSPRHAPIVSVSIDNEVLAAALDGQALSERIDSAASDEKKELAFRYYALGQDGIELSLRVRPAQPVRITAVDISYGLPEIQGVTLKPRPEYMMPAGNRTFAQDSTMVSKSFTF